MNVTRESYLKRNVIREYLNACEAWFISWGMRDSWIICVWSWKCRFPEVSPTMTDSKRDAWILLKFVRETGSRLPFATRQYWVLLNYVNKKKISTCQGKLKTHAPVSSGCRISDRLLYIMLAFCSRIFVRQKHKALLNHFSGIFTENNQQDQYPWKVTLTRHLNFAIRQQWVTCYPLNIKDHMLLTCYSSFLCCTYTPLLSFYLR